MSNVTSAIAFVYESRSLRGALAYIFNSIQSISGAPISGTCVMGLRELTGTDRR